MQNKKRTHFFRYVSESLHNHFKQWTNDLFFLSLFSPQATATIVANVILGKTIDMAQTYYCSIHTRNINLLAFNCFLNDWCSDITIMAECCLSFCKTTIPFN